MKLKYVLKQDDLHENINQVLINEFKISTRLLSKLIRLQKIYLNSKVVDSRTSVNYNDLIEIDLSYKEDNSNIVPTEMDLDIIYEDEWFLVINKPARNSYSSFLYALQRFFIKWYSFLFR